MKDIKLSVKGMHCHSCEMLITDELQEIAGVKKAEASHKENLVKIQADDNVDVEKIKAKIKELGYEVGQ
jgi:copper chaperone CopZ